MGIFWTMDNDKENGKKEKVKQNEKEKKWNKVEDK